MAQEKPVLSPGDLLFPRIFQAFRMAIQPAKLAIAFVAVVIVCLAGWIMDLNPTVITAATYTTPVSSGAAADLSLHTIQDATELDLYVIHGTSALRNFVEAREALGSRTGLFSALRRFGTGRFHNSLYAPHQIVGHLADGLKALEWAFRWHPLYSIVFFTLTLILLGVAGGAICRIAALEFARSERPGLLQAVRFALNRLIHLLGGLFGPILLVFVFGAPVMLLGLAANIPVVGELLAGLLLPLAFVAVCAAIITLIGTVAGFGLTVPAVAYEDSDSFDAINHSFSYVYSRPWHLGFYTMVAAVYGALCYLFVRVFGYLLLWTTYRFLQIGFLRQNEKLHVIWPEPTLTDFFGHAAAPPDTWSLWLGFLLTRVWVFGVAALMASFAISFYFSANTIIYALMRQRVDGTAIEEVYACPGEDSAERFSLEAEPEPGLSTPAS